MATPKRKRTSKQKIVQQRRMFVGAIAAIIIFLIGTLIYNISLLGYDKVHEGVSINGESVSGLTEEELLGKLSGMFDFSHVYDIKIQVEDAEEIVNTLALAPTPDLDAMLEAAMSCGRTKRGLSRIGEIKDLKKEPVNLPYILTFDEDVLQDVLDDISDKLNISASENQIEVGQDCIYITRGVSGRGLIYNDVKMAISECILNDDKVVKLSLTEINPEEITLDLLKRHTYETPQDSTYTIQDHKLLFTESHPGVKFKDKEVKRAIKEASGRSQFKVPAIITQPNATIESLRKELLGDVLGTFSSDFSTSSNDRAHNIKLACSKVDGYVLAPGEEFSYNDVVGDRTLEAGYKMANVYVGSEVQPGIGGGICQVSSTMFSAVVFADLEITERRNHSLPVSYVPMGQDATVSYGSIDFKFKNTYDTPIEMSPICEGRKNIITIRGKKKNTDRTIEMVSEKTGTIEPKVVQKRDATLPEGTTKVEEKGSSGSTYVTYKIVKEKGKEVSREVLCKSTYRAKDRIELIGTKKNKTEDSEPTEPQKAVATPKPSEEADEEV